MATASSETFRASLSRCLANADFLRIFYERFMDSSDEVKEKFKNTEFPRQARVLADSLYLMAVASESQDDSIAMRELDRLADRHSSADLDVQPRFYESWLECLISAARDYDPDFSPAIEVAWRQSLAPGIEHLRSRY